MSKWDEKKRELSEKLNQQQLMYDKFWMFEKADEDFEVGSVEHQAAIHGWNNFWRGNQVGAQEYLDTVANPDGQSKTKDGKTRDFMEVTPGYYDHYLDYKNKSYDYNSKVDNPANFKSARHMLKDDNDFLGFDLSGRTRESESLAPTVEQPDPNASQFDLRGGGGGLMKSMPEWTGMPGAADYLFPGTEGGQNVPFQPNPPTEWNQQGGDVFPSQEVLSQMKGPNVQAQVNAEAANTVQQEMQNIQQLNGLGNEALEEQMNILNRYNMDKKNY